MAFQRSQGAMQGLQLEPLSEGRPLSFLPGALVHRGA